MELSPEERQRIYEEEKARIEAERLRNQKAGSASFAGLPQNIASLLCYLGFWVSGIIFLLIEKQNKVVRFHAAQSLLLFGFLSMVSFPLGYLPGIGWFFDLSIGILTFILWVVLMVKAYNGEMFKIPLVSRIAADMVDGTPEVYQTQSAGGTQTPDKEAVVSEMVQKLAHERILGRTGRIIACSVGIFWDIVLIVFLNFYNQYIAYYHMVGEDVWYRESLLTADFSRWLPVVTTALALSIVGNILMIIFDAYPVRQLVRMGKSILAIWVLGSLINIFPFDFGAIQVSALADMLPWIISLVLVLVIISLAVSVVVRVVKLVLYLTGMSRVKSG